MFLDTAIAKLADITVPNISANSSEEDREEHCSKLTATVMATSISGWASRYNEKERGNYYTFILRGVPNRFLKEVFQIRAASEMLTVNVETIRRKIRDKKIPVLNEGKVNTGVGYEITGATVISLAKKNYQKESILAYCIEKYPCEMVISLIQLLINEGSGFKNLTSDMAQSLVNLAYVAELKVKDIPKGEIAEINEAVCDNYAFYLETKKDSEKNKKVEEVDFAQKEKEYQEEIERLKDDWFEEYEENLYLKITVNKLCIKLMKHDLEQLDKDTQIQEQLRVLRAIRITRERIEYLEECQENGEIPTNKGWPFGTI